VNDIAAPWRRGLRMRSPFALARRAARGCVRVFLAALCVSRSNERRAADIWLHTARQTTKCGEYRTRSIAATKTSNRHSYTARKTHACGDNIITWRTSRNGVGRRNIKGMVLRWYVAARRFRRQRCHPATVWRIFGAK